LNRERPTALFAQGPTHVPVQILVRDGAGFPAGPVDCLGERFPCHWLEQITLVSLRMNVQRFCRSPFQKNEPRGPICSKPRLEIADIARGNQRLRSNCSMEKSAGFRFVLSICRYTMAGGEFRDQAEKTAKVCKAP
jgi:hypothetical protein